MGKYQFGSGTLRGLGYDLSRNLLNHPEIQEKAMLDLLKHNKKKLQKFIDKYEGDTVHGVYITESGILMAHCSKEQKRKKILQERISI